jgi:hypothetical protein
VAASGTAVAPSVQVTNTTVGRDFNVTLPEASIYEAFGRPEYLARALSTSDARIAQRRSGAGLTGAQIARIESILPPVPRSLVAFGSGEIRVLVGPLGSGKSDIAEGWLQIAVTAAQQNAEARVPVWVSIDDLESSLERHVLREIGVTALETAGADIVVDGLDERSDRAGTVAMQVSSLVHRWPRCRVLLTSRAGDGFPEGVRVEVRPLRKSQARQLVTLVAGGPVDDLSSQLEESLERPLFALLVGQSSVSGQVTTMAEVLDLVVARIVSAQGQGLYTKLRQLAVHTVTAGRSVDPESFTSFDIAIELRRSPFVVTVDGKCSFGLATFEQWFAAKAILEDVVQVDEILSGLNSFSRWKYVLSLVLASGDPARVDGLMARIARWNPGAAAWLIKETSKGGLERNRSTESNFDWLTTGNRIRFAVAALLDGLGPLSAAFNPFRVTGISEFDRFALAVQIGPDRINATWLIADQIPSAPLNPVEDLSNTDLLAGMSRSFFMQTFPLPPSRNWVWEAAMKVISSDLSSNFTAVAVEAATAVDGIARAEQESARKRRREPYDPSAPGRSTYEDLYPGPDRPPVDESSWPTFSTNGLANRVTAIVRAWIDCYLQLCDSVAPRFGDTLAHRGLMPFEYYASLHVNAPEFGESLSFNSAVFSSIQWALIPTGTPLPNDERHGQNTVNIAINDDTRFANFDEQLDVLSEPYKRYLLSNPAYEPFADSFMITHGGLDIFDSMPAFHLAIGWLWRDLVNLGWVSGFMPTR